MIRFVARKLRAATCPSVVALALMLGLWTGCGSREAAPAATDEGPKLFQEGKGLKLSAETWKSLGLETAAAVPRTVHTEAGGTAQVFERGTNAAGVPRVLASAFIPVTAHRSLEGTAVVFSPADVPSATVTGTVLRVDSSSRAAFGQAEVVVELLETGRAATLGSFGQVRLQTAPVEAASAVPRGSLVRAALGDFVYVAEGEFLKRVPVKVGAEDSGWMEVLDGVSPGKTVVTRGAQALWLLELSEVGGMANIK